jgi:hypothetical protein
MVREEIQFTRSKNLLRTTQADETVRIVVKDFELRARQVEVHDLTPFYSSSLFDNGFVLDEVNRVIVRR